jgi:hypothetical protein
MGGGGRPAEAEEVVEEVTEEGWKAEGAGVAASLGAVRVAVVAVGAVVPDMTEYVGAEATDEVAAEEEAREGKKRTVRCLYRNGIGIATCGIFLDITRISLLNLLQILLIPESFQIPGVISANIIPSPVHTRIKTILATLSVTKKSTNIRTP